MRHVLQIRWRLSKTLATKGANKILFTLEDIVLSTKVREEVIFMLIELQLIEWNAGYFLVGFAESWRD